MYTLIFGAVYVLSAVAFIQWCIWDKRGRMNLSIKDIMPVVFWGLIPVLNSLLLLLYIVDALEKAEFMNKKFISRRRD